MDFIKKNSVDYLDFIAEKQKLIESSGFDIDKNTLNPLLYNFQKDIVRWALAKGKSAIFADCGLGKTPMQLEWANQICNHTGGNVLILAPLAVASQTVEEGKKFNISVNICESQADVKDGIKGDRPTPDMEKYAKKEKYNEVPVYSHQVWRRYASPVWMDIRQSNTLNKIAARDEKDERHICPLQLDVIARCIELWSNPNDIVFTPFMGIGSEVYQAILMGRRAMGIELKESYYNESLINCENALWDYILKGAVMVDDKQ